MELASEIVAANEADAVLEAFLAAVEAQGLSLYPAQEEAILELYAGHNVILNTPTGSGKSMVALAAHFDVLCRGGRSFYTAPIKALVSEKFFALSRTLGPDNVGMMTGDASVNRDAPVICCTAEILSNLALAEGERADVTQVVMDEFHFYADRERGKAWQIPLLTLPQAQFLLMSATLGDTERFENELRERTGRETVLVKTAERPVPLEFAYREVPLLHSIQQLVEDGNVPAYIVHFTQRSAVQEAQNLMSVDFLSKEQKAAIKDELRGFQFDTPFGKELRRYVYHGVGVHHAGLLPKYRLMVEKLAQKGMLKVICGTDTLGVGINVPIRAVLFTKLCKYDGEKTAVLSVRDFKQIAGRAGRKGFDDKGLVWAQAPEHVVENKKLEAKAAGDAKKLRKLVRKKPPERGYAHWDAQTFERLIDGESEPLQSSFSVSHAMVMQLLDRPGDGCAALKTLIRDSHESEREKKQHGLRAIAIFRALRNSGVLEVLDAPDAQGRLVRVAHDLQLDFALNQDLSPFVLYALDALDSLHESEAPKAARDEPSAGRTGCGSNHIHGSGGAQGEEQRALDVVTICESVLEQPRAVLLKQLDKLRGDLVSELKADGVPYEERMEQLEKVEHPKPLAEFLYQTFNAFKEAEPWVQDENVAPKSILRDMWEKSANFNAYVKEYGLARSEGVLLRYLMSAYKVLLQTVPDERKDDALWELIDWLEATLKTVDSSLLDEWNQLRDPEAAPKEIDQPIPSGDAQDITQDEKAFTALLRRGCFGFVALLARGRYDLASEELDNARLWPPEKLKDAFAPFLAEYGKPLLDQAARSPSRLTIEPTNDGWTVTQVLSDETGNHDWAAIFEVSRARSREEGQPVLELEALGEP